MSRRPIPAHGTYARANGSPGYREPCKCEPCTLTKRRSNKRWKVNKARGKSSTTTAAPAREHLFMLRATRTWESIAHASDTAESNLMLIANGQRTTIHVSTHNAILAVQPLDKPLPTTHTDATGTRRRLQALMAIGHSLRTLSGECRVSKDRLRDIAMGLEPTVSYGLAERIKAIYERLAYKPPAFNKYTARTRNLAASRGWVGPLAWDGNIDDPDAKPEQLPAYKPAAKYRRDPLRKAEIEHLHLCGESIEAIAKRLGNTEKYVSDQLGAIRRERAAQEKTAKAGLEAAA